jgi:hypothetical protein
MAVESRPIASSIVVLFPTVTRIVTEPPDKPLSLLRKVTSSMSTSTSVDIGIDWDWFGSVPDASLDRAQQDSGFLSSDLITTFNHTSILQPLNNMTLPSGYNSHSDTEVERLRITGVVPKFARVEVPTIEPEVVVVEEEPKKKGLAGKKGQVLVERQWYKAADPCEECANNGHECMVPKSFNGKLKKCQRCSSVKQLCSLRKFFDFGFVWEYRS